MVFGEIPYFDISTFTASNWPAAAAICIAWKPCYDEKKNFYTHTGWTNTLY